MVLIVSMITATAMLHHQHSHSHTYDHINLTDDVQKMRKKQSNDLENRRLMNDLESKRNNKKYQELLDVRSSLPAFQMRYVRMYLHSPTVRFALRYCRLKTTLLVSRCEQQINLSCVNDLMAGIFNYISSTYSITFIIHMLLFISLTILCSAIVLESFITYHIMRSFSRHISSSLFLTFHFFASPSFVVLLF